ncbi:MAG: N-acylneuraminate-9-phosphate synthase [Candidatus Curtissbacteria bacterium GW2011_GWA1_40_16]|uniref:N-acylneuraminate-9-phosphate synthase n=1 Tax=Candidatus Curtissbacteria bacterium GW2011_GWA1_40_16 TaxID=1618405 RepID=A0A0G0RC15_9BACT|nr:MAG: N-acylneuraminate-9-phosphate synthase [Candidatus Curtissbacteria bacterium GW2011_GWA1_40_16]
MNPFIKIGKRKIGRDFYPFVIAEVGINHEGSMKKAKQMVLDAYKSGAECVKFQAHVIEDEMIPAAKKVIPDNANESIWEIMKRCALSEEEDSKLKKYVESLGMIYLSTPFSRAAAERLNRLNVTAFKIGSGECNNYPLVEHIAKFGKPVILSTGMNDLKSIETAVKIFRKHHASYALLHCTSMYPTPYSKVRLGVLDQLRETFPDAVLGLSDHSLGIYTCFGATAKGASILEKHFTSNKKWSGPDIPISIDGVQLKDLIVGSRAIFKALEGKKSILPEEKQTIKFAYACVVTTRKIKKGEKFSIDNIWVKRPGTGQIQASEYKRVLHRKSIKDLPKNYQIKWREVS